MIKEFIGFLKLYGVIGLAIAVVIGGKLNEFLMPVLFQPLLKAANVADIRLLNYNGIFYGKVIGAAVDFLIVAVVVFMFAKHVLREPEVAKK
jgi:large conductance mechanosensitive channel